MARVSVIIPTLNGGDTLPELLGGIARVRAKHDIEVVAIDSGSTDGTIDQLKAAGARVLDLGGKPFGHASARNRAAEQATGDVLLYVTQDVEPVGDEWLEPLLAALEPEHVAGAFGRQVPRDASPEEAFLARANYGDRARTLTKDDIARFGPGAPLFSHAFGAVKRSAWQRFPVPDIVMSEDQAWALEVLRAGLMIRYVPDASVYHGHWFTLGKAFRRNFDSGSSLQQLGLTGGMWGVGLSHLVRELGEVRREHGVLDAGYTLIYESVRMLGFQCGRFERVMPKSMARWLGEAPR